MIRLTLTSNVVSYCNITLRAILLTNLESVNAVVLLTSDLLDTSVFLSVSMNETVESVLNS